MKSALGLLDDGIQLGVNPERRTDGSEETIPFDNIYLVRVVNDAARISAYITGDEQQALREHGIVDQ